MEEKPTPVTRPTGKNHRQYPVDDDATGDFIECSGDNCQTCTAELIADCVAVCCCPCAVLNILTLALVKFPWMMGRRCLGLRKKKGSMFENKRKCERNYIDFGVDIDGISRNGRVDLEIGSSGFDDLSGKFEAEKVWLELYQQVGDHLGFGRLSYTGISSQDEGN